MFYTRFLLISGTITILFIFLNSCSLIKNSTHQTSRQSEIFSNIISLVNHGKNLIQKEQDSNAKTIANEREIVDSMVFNDLSEQYNLQKSDLLTDTAKLLAGMQISDRSQLADIKNTIAWSNHRQIMTNSWTKLQSQQLSKIRQWRKSELDEINQLEIGVFYPFSNSNFLYAYSLFPKSKEFMLFGIEPIGDIPKLENLNDLELETEFKTTRNYLDAILPQNYFNIDDSQNLQTRSALPALYVFLARTNNRLIDIENVGIDEAGTLQALESAMIPGVKITFITQGESEPRVLYYFSMDLSNENLENYPEVIKFISYQKNNVTYLNAASYLTHFDTFSTISQLILAQSDYILQDDSGLPINAFYDQGWNLEFYGSYTRPITLFEDKYQPQLWQIYNFQENIKPLDFTVGYQRENEGSNLMLAKTKK